MILNHNACRAVLFSWDYRSGKNKTVLNKFKYHTKVPEGNNRLSDSRISSPAASAFIRVAACILAAVIVSCLFASCAEERIDIAARGAAVLHSENDRGYIPCVAEQMDIDILSHQAFVYDVNNDEFLYLKGSAYLLYPASTTKLLTILYALELLDPSEIITPGNELELVGEGSSTAYIRQNHRLSVEMLIEGMLLPSGNDAAYVLAAAAGARLAEKAGLKETSEKGLDGKAAVRIFLDGMNTYATEHGLCGSSFISPDGYYNENHYTTIEDIALVAKMASQNKIIMKYAGMSYDNVTYASGHTNTWKNTNLLLDPESAYYSKYVTGLKTGSAGAGNYSLISTVDLDDTGRYIIGIFSSEGKNDRYIDTLKIIDCLQAGK